MKLRRHEKGSRTLRAIPGEGDGELLDGLISPIDERPPTEQRREHVRLRMRRPMVVSRESEQAGPLQVETYTVDVSGNGVLMAGPEALAVGDRVHLEIAIAPGDHRVLAKGTIVRADESGERAVALDQIESMQQRRLVRFVFECQRRLARSRRMLTDELTQLRPGRHRTAGPGGLPSPEELGLRPIDPEERAGEPTGDPQDLGLPRHPALRRTTDPADDRSDDGA